MKRIMIAGCGGAGKSTLARRLGKKLNIPVIHLDLHFWNDGWIATPKDEFKEKQYRLLEAGQWIVDGNYRSTIDIRLDKSDTIIFLDISRWRCLFRVFKRLLSSYTGLRRADIPKGCKDKVDWEFVQWIWSYPRDARVEIFEKIDALPPGKNIVVLRSNRDIEEFLAAL